MSIPSSTSAVGDAVAKPLSAWRSPWVLAWIGLVATVLVVNLVMVFLAIATNPGLVNADYYERGQDYEQTLVSRRERFPEWTIQSDIPAGIGVGAPEVLRVFIVDKAGQPVDPDAVNFLAYRPADAGRDFAVPMRREAPGRYAVEVSFPLLGVWDTLIAVQQGDDEYSVTERVRVEPR